MYRVRHYSDVNIGATAILMELLLEGKYPVQSVVVASSRAVYGEGAAQCPEHGLVYPYPRSKESMEAGTSSRSALPAAVQQEWLRPPRRRLSAHLPCMGNQAGAGADGAYVCVHLGYQRLRTALSERVRAWSVAQKSYTGILAIFSNQARANEPIYVFEDGKESRDFVYVDDVVEATVRSIEATAQKPVALNVAREFLFRLRKWLTTLLRISPAIPG